jgi:CheY-like chemotaxis protein
VRSSWERILQRYSCVVMPSRVLGSPPTPWIAALPRVVAARESPPDLVLVDVQLRDVPGDEAIGWLRSNPALQSTPIIVLATNAEDDVVPTLARAYASLPKPVSPAAIRRTIREVLN